MLSDLKERFEVLIIDTPPVLLASDTLLLAAQTDGVVLVIKAGLMKREIIKSAVEQLRMARVNLLGVALSQVDIKKEGYYKYHRKLYSKYYKSSRISNQ